MRRRWGAAPGAAPRLPSTPAGRRRLAGGEIAFLILLAFLLILLYLVLESVLVAIFLAMVLEVLTDRPYEWLVRRLGGKRRLAAVLGSAAVTLIILAPIGGIGFLVAEQITAFIARSRASPSRAATTTVSSFSRHFPSLARWASAAEGQIYHYLGVEIPRLLATGARDVGLGVLTILALYAFYVSGRDWWESFVRLTPIDERYMRDLGREFQTVVFSVILGLFLSAIAHGAVGYGGYLIFHVPNAILWAAVTFVAAFIPVVGTAIVWVPVAIWLFVNGRTGSAIGLIVYAVVLMGAVEYILRPILMGGRTALPDVLVLLALIGGIAEFGPIGLFLGPMLAAIALAAVRIWARDFRPRLPPELPKGVTHV